MKKRIWITLIVALLAFCLLSVSAAAESGEESEALTFGETVTAFVTEHSAEIFSALALMGTGVLTWCYRKGLLPVLAKGLGQVSGGVERLVESAREAAESGNAEIREQLERLAPVIAAAEGIGEGLERLSARLKELEEESNRTAEERERLLILSEASVAILKEVFTAAKLPAASKEELAALYGRMRSSLDALGAGEKQ